MASKNTIYQSSPPYIIISFFVLIVLIIVGRWVYLDLEKDGIIFNDIYLYESMASIFFTVFIVLFAFSFFLYVKIVITNDELIISRMKLYFWAKPYRFKIKNIKKVGFYAGRPPDITISYIPNDYPNAVAKKTINYWGIGTKSKKRLIAKLIEYGIVVQNNCKIITPLSTTNSTSLSDHL